MGAGDGPGIREGDPAFPVMSTEQARDLADVVADKLDRLAADIDTAASLTLAGAPAADRGRARRTVVDSRGEAAGALGRLAVALPDGSHERRDAETLHGVLGGDTLVTAGDCRMLARAWRAFADA